MLNDGGEFRPLSRVGNGLRQLRNWDAPFPVSPSGGKPGRAGSPHAGEHVARQQKALALAVRPAPPARGAQPPLRIPPCPSPKAHLGLHYFGASEEMKKSLTIAALSDMAHIRLINDFLERSDRLNRSTSTNWAFPSMQPPTAQGMNAPPA